LVGPAFLRHPLLCLFISGWRWPTENFWHPESRDRCLFRVTSLPSRKKFIPALFPPPSRSSECVPLIVPGPLPPSFSFPQILRMRPLDPFFFHVYLSWSTPRRLSFLASWLHPFFDLENRLPFLTSFLCPPSHCTFGSDFFWRTFPRPLPKLCVPQCSPLFGFLFPPPPASRSGDLWVGAGLFGCPSIFLFFLDVSRKLLGAFFSPFLSSFHRDWAFSRQPGHTESPPPKLPFCDWAEILRLLEPVQVFGGLPKGTSAFGRPLRDSAFPVVFWFPRSILACGLI